MKLVTRSKAEYHSGKLIHSKGNTEYWWNLSIKTAIITKSNKLALIIWNNEVKTHQEVEFSCAANIVSRKLSEKENIIQTFETWNAVALTRL